MVKRMSPDIPTLGAAMPTAPLSRTSVELASPAPTRSTPIVLLFALLMIALVARTVFLLWEPPFEGTVDYDAIAPLGGAYWTMHLYLGGPAFAVTWVGFAVFVTFLARGRSAIATLAASVAIGLGGIVFALVVTAESLPFAFAADTTVFREDTGRAIFDALNGNLALLAPPILGSQFVIAGGVLIVLVVALVTRAMPRWFSIAGLAFLVAFVALPLETFPRGAVIAVDLVQTVLVGGISWFGLKAALRREAERASG